MNKKSDCQGTEEDSTNLNSDAKSSIQKNEKHKIQDKKRKGHKLPWAVAVLFISLILSFLINFLSEILLGNTTKVILAYVILLIIVFIGIMFDLIGTATTSCDIEPFLSMAARKVRGSKMAVKMCQNADRVSSICCDIVGDICGVVSGVCGATIVAIQFTAIETDIAAALISAGFFALVSTLTITGKALGKKYAITKSNDIVLAVAKMLIIFKKEC